MRHDSPGRLSRINGSSGTKGRQVPNGHQVPSLTLRDMLHPDGHHVSIGCHVPRGRQVPNGHQASSLTPCDMVCPDGSHVSMEVIRCPP